MSKVDERIVEMKFENHLFDKNVQSSINALDKLKAALKFDGAEKSLANVEKSVNTLDFSKLSASVESLSSRFSNWGIVGMTVIQDLTHAAENLGKTMVNATLGQIKSGGWKRATNIDQAKFMLQGLGVAWDDIKEDIDYGVLDTAYGMDAAARAASQLKASGVELGDEMKTSLRAISGVAAMTNSSYEEISPIFTTIAGQGQVMTMQLRQLESRGLNVAATLGEQLGKTESEIRDMVTKGKISFQEFAKAMDDAYGTHAKEANSTFEGSMANMKSALSRIGQNFAAPIRANMIGIFNALKGIINELNKVRFTQIYKDFEDFAGKASGFVQNVLSKIDLSFVDELVNKLHEAYVTFDTIMSEINPLWKHVETSEEKVTEVTETNTKALEDYEAVVKRVLNNEYGNGEARNKRLEEEGYNWKVVQNMVNEASNSNFRYEVSEEELAKAYGEKTEALKEANAEEEKGRKARHAANDEYIKELGWVKDAEKDASKATKVAYQKYSEQQEKIAKANERQRNIHETIETLRTKLTPIVEGITSAFNIITNTVSAIVEGAIDPAIRIFESLGSIILDVLGFLGMGVSSIDATMESVDAYGTITNTVNEVLGTFADILETIAKVVSDLTHGVSISDILVKLLGNSSDAATAEINGDAISGFVEKVGEAIIGLKNFISDSDFSFSDLVDHLSNLFPILSKLWPVLLEMIKGILAYKGTKALSSFFDTIAQVPKQLQAAANEKNSTSLLKLAGAIAIVAFAFYNLANLSWEGVGKAAVAIVTITAALGGLYFLMTKLNDGEGLLGLAKNFSSSIANNNNANAIIKVAGAFAILSLAMAGLAQLSWEQIGKGAVAIAAITAAVSAIMLVMARTKKAQSLVTVNNPITAFAHSITNIGNAIKKTVGIAKIALLVGTIGAAVYAIGKAVVLLADIPWQKGLIACGFIALILAELIGATAILQKMSKKNKFTSDAEDAMYSLRGLINACANVLKVLAEMSFTQALGASVVLGIILAELVATMLVMSHINMGDMKKNTLVTTLMFSSIAFVAKSLANTVKSLAEIDFKSGLQACGFLAIILLELLGTIAILTKLGKSSGAFGTAVIMGSIAVTVRSLSSTLKSLSAVKWESGLKSCKFIGILLLELVAAVGLISSFSRHAGAIGTSMLMGALALTIKSLSNTIQSLSEIDFMKGLKACALMGLMMLELTASIGILSAFSRKSGALGTSILMGALALVLTSLKDTVKSLSEIDFDSGLNACALIGVLLLEIVGTIGLVSLLSGTKGVAKFGIFLAGFALAIKAMSSSVVELGGLKARAINNAVSAMYDLGGLMAALMVVGRLTGGGKTAGLKNIIPIVLLLGALTGSLKVLASADQKNLPNAVKALTKVVILLTAMLVALSRLQGNKIEIGNIISMVGIIAAVVGAMYLLSTLPMENVSTVGSALTKVFLGVTAMIAAVSLLGNLQEVDAGTILASLGGVMLLVAEVAGALSLMTLLSDDQINKLDPIADALSQLYVSVGLVVAAVALFDKLGSDGKDGVDAGTVEAIKSAGKAGSTGKTIAIVAVVTGLVGFIGWLDNQLKEAGINDGEGILQGIADAFAAWEPIVSEIGSLVGSILGGLLAGIVEGLTGSSPEELIEDFKEGIANLPDTLSNLVDGISTFVSDISAAGAEGKIDTGAIGNFKKVVDDIGLMSKTILEVVADFNMIKYDYQAIKTTDNKDVEMSGTSFSEWFTAWGSIFSEFGSTITAGVFDPTQVNQSITDITTVLTNFTSVLDAASNLDGIDDATDNINKLPEVAKALLDYSWTVPFINTAAVESTQGAIDIINSLAAKGVEIGNDNNWGFLEGMIGCGTALQGYVKDLPLFAEGLKTFADNIQGMEAYTNSVAAIKPTVDMINAMAAGGVESGQDNFLTWIGNADNAKAITALGTVGSELGGFGAGLQAFAKEMQGMEQYTTSVEATENAVGIINNLAKTGVEVGNANFTGLFGDDGPITALSKYSDDLAGFGKGLVKYAWAINHMNVGAVFKTQLAASMIVALTNAIPDTGNGILGLLFGSKDSLDNFSDNLPNLGKAFADFSSECANFDERNALKVINAFEQITNTANVLAGYSQSVGGDVVDQEVNAAVEMVSSALEALAWEDLPDDADMQAIVDWGEKIGQVLVGAIGEGSKVAKAVNGGEAKSALSSILDSMLGDDSAVAASIESADVGNKIATALTNAIANAFGGSGKGGDNVAGAIGDSVDCTSAGENIVKSLLEAIQTKIDATTANDIETTPFLTAMSEGIENKKDSMVSTGSSLASALAEGIRSNRWAANNAGSSLGSAAASGARSHRDNMYSAGVYVGAGFAAGIKSEVSAAITATTQMANSAVQNTKDKLNQNSPSRVFMEIGAGVVEGFVKGINDNRHFVVDATTGMSLLSVGTATDTLETGIREMAKSTSRSLAAAYTYINEVANSSLNSSPVITPVLDMSNFQNGINSMNGVVASSFGYAYSAFPSSYDYLRSAQANDAYVTQTELRGIRTDLKNLGEAITHMNMVLDSGTLVGQLTPGIDSQLGAISGLKERWA